MCIASEHPLCAPVAPAAAPQAHTPTCDMHSTCQAPVAMIDQDGYVYCEPHGMRRRNGGRPCRKLRPAEVRKLARGERITKY